jgi:hypothetical protein
MLTRKQRAEIRALRDQNRALMANLELSIARTETAMVREDALRLAITERLGREARDGDAITDRDEERAEQIMRFWSADLRA